MAILANDFMPEYRDDKPSLHASIERLERELAETKVELGDTKARLAHAKGEKSLCPPGDVAPNPVENATSHAPGAAAASRSVSLTHEDRRAARTRFRAPHVVAALRIGALILEYRHMILAVAVVSIGPAMLMYSCVVSERDAKRRNQEDAARAAREASMVRTVEATWKASVVRAEGTYLPPDTACSLVVNARGNGRESEIRSIRVVCGNLKWSRENPKCPLNEHPDKLPGTFSYSLTCTLEESGESKGPRGIGVIPAKDGISVATTDGRVIVKTTAPSFLELSVDRESAPNHGMPLIDPL
jgi:hypothetical protein